MKLERMTIVERYGEGVYREHRIPSVVITSKGTIVTATEARKEAHNDWAEIQISVRRSEDDGITFSEPIYPAMILQEPGKKESVSWNNPVLIADKEIIHLLFHQNYEKAWYCYSTDEGKSFSVPTEITDVFRQFPTEWNVCASGPGHGIVADDGRLVVPIWLANGKVCYDLEKTGRIKEHHPSVAGCIYSEDRGKSWKCGFLTYGIENANETTVSQMKDGRFLFNFRNERFEQCRVMGIADRNLEKLERVWSEPDLADPICFGSMVAKEGVQYFVNCANRDLAKRWAPRIHLTVKASTDDAGTWETAVLVDEIGGYADIAAGEDGIYIFYEKSVQGQVETLQLKKYIW